MLRLKPGGEPSWLHELVGFHALAVAFDYRGLQSADFRELSLGLGVASERLVGLAQGQPDRLLAYAGKRGNVAAQADGAGATCGEVISELSGYVPNGRNLVPLPPARPVAGEGKRDRDFPTAESALRAPEGARGAAEFP